MIEIDPDLSDEELADLYRKCLGEEMVRFFTDRERDYLREQLRELQGN